MEFHKPMSLVLAVKLFLVPFLIHTVTLVGRRWGPAVAGWLSAFPIISGPILLVVALEQGNQFAAAAAGGTLLAVIAILVFSIVYALASSRFGAAGSLATALLAYAAAVALLQTLRLPAPASFVIVCFALAMAPRLFPTIDEAMPAAAGGYNDVPWRMLAGTVLVLSVTFAAAHIGARLSGFFAMFPVMSTVVVGFSHARAGRAFAVRLLQGMVFGYYAFAVFCLAIAMLLGQHSVAFAFCAAFACALVVQMIGKRVMARQRARALPVLTAPPRQSPG
jgi:hypothetical protein